MYSITNRESFEAIPALIEGILRTKDESSWPFVLVGTKSDLHAERTVSTEEAQKLAEKYNCKHLEASAKLRMNVDESVRTMMESILQVVRQSNVVYASPKK